MARQTAHPDLQDLIIEAAHSAPPGWRTGIAYYRISDDPDHDELGVRRQRKLVRAKAERDHVHLVAEYMDDDRSAYTRKRRPEYEKLLAHANDVDVVMAWHPDRMTRGDLIEIERLIVALGGDNGTPITTCETADYDVTTPHGRMIARLTGTVARYESEHKSARLREKMQELAENGMPRGGRRGFGYEADGMTINAEEARLIKAAVKAVLKGASPRQIAKEWNDAGIVTTAGNPWHPGVLRNMLVSPRLAGKRVHHGAVLRDGLWPGIIDESTHRRVIAALAERSPVGRRGKTPWLLTGLLRCGRCGATLVGNTASASGTRSYVCRKAPGYKGCGGLATKAEPVEELIGAAFIKRMDERTRRKTDVGEDDSDELHELDRIAAQRAQAHEDNGKGVYANRADFHTELRVLAQAQKAVEKRIAAKVSKSAVLDFTDDGRPWSALDVEEKRRRLHAVIASVTVAPSTAPGSRVFDPSRIDPDLIEWKV